MEKRVLVGVDGGSREHVVEAVKEETGEVERFRIGNDHAGCDEFLEHVRKWKAAGYEVWIGAEGKGGWLSPLDLRACAAGCKWVNIPTTQFKRFRQAVSVQPDKTDEIDAHLLVELLRWLLSQNRAQVCDCGDVYFQELQGLSRSHEALVRSKVGLEQQLVGLVREFWPELVRKGCFFSTTDSLAMLALLEKYPTPELVVKAGRGRVAKVLQKASGRPQQDLADRLVSQAARVAQLMCVSPCRSRLIEMLAASLAAQMRTLRELEKDLEELLRQNPFGTWLLKQKGIGAVTAAAFLGEAGNLDRFDSESKLARYAGNGANRSQSGGSRERHYDGRCYNHRLKRAIMLMANARYLWHEPSRRYVLERKNTSADHWTILKKLARHLIRFLWKAWQETVKDPSLTYAEKRLTL